MLIENLSVKSAGYVHCKSDFYSSHDTLNGEMYNFNIGVNKLVGEIDSGKWAISYLLSMYQQNPKDFVLDFNAATVNETAMSLAKVMEYSCYMDKSYSLFTSNSNVKKLVEKGIKKNKLDVSSEDIRDIFHIDNARFERPLSGVGNEIFRAMSAIGFANGKQVFCFPWLSQKRFDSYHGHLTDLLYILENLKKIVVLPIGE